MRARFAPIALLACFTAATQAPAAELPKKGSYAGKFGFYANGKIHELDKGHIMFTGEFGGAFFNDANGGFLHGASVVCPGVNDVFLDGRESRAMGYCVVTDMDGDKAFLSWENKGGPIVRPGGTFTWMSGTGKYAGIKGSNTFDVTIIPNTPSGFAIWRGSYELP
jgi:hypothetical protein